MDFYNKLMSYFWVLLAIVSTVIVTYLGFTEGFERWAYMYAVPIVATLMFFFKRWMIKRMKKHMEFLEEKNKNS